MTIVAKSHVHRRFRGQSYFEKSYVNFNAGFRELFSSRITKDLPSAALIDVAKIGGAIHFLYEDLGGDVLTRIGSADEKKFIASTLSQIHSRHFRQGPKEQNINLSRIRRKLASLSLISADLPGVTKALIREWDAYFCEVGGSPIRAMTHGDISGNVLETKRGLRVVDFEHAGIGDPAYEVATLLCRHNIDRHHDIFIKHYSPASILRFSPQYFPLVILEHLIWALENWKAHQKVAARNLFQNRLDYFHAYKYRLDDELFRWQVVTAQ